MRQLSVNALAASMPHLHIGRQPRCARAGSRARSGLMPDVGPGCYPGCRGISHGPGPYARFPGFHIRVILCNVIVRAGYVLVVDLSVFTAASTVRPNGHVGVPAKHRSNCQRFQRVRGSRHRLPQGPFRRYSPRNGHAGNDRFTATACRAPGNSSAGCNRARRRRVRGPGPPRRRLDSPPARLLCRGRVPRCAAPGVSLTTEGSRNTGYGPFGLPPRAAGSSPEAGEVTVTRSVSAIRGGFGGQARVSLRSPAGDRGHSAHDK